MADAHSSKQGPKEHVPESHRISTDLYECCLQLFLTILKVQGRHASASALQRLRVQAQR